MRHEQYDGKVVRASCPHCEGPSRYTTKDVSGQTHPAIVKSFEKAISQRETIDATYEYRLVECEGCGRGALAVIDVTYYHQSPGYVEDFYPRWKEKTELPSAVPEGVRHEFVEAESCAEHGLYRAACAVLRSALEKVLLENGYDTRHLPEKIKQAAADQIITPAQGSMADRAVRTLGRDILHRPWRPVERREFETARKYVHRIIDELYDDRPFVERRLAEVGRLQQKPVEPLPELDEES